MAARRDASSTITLASGRSARSWRTQAGLFFRASLSMGASSWGNDTGNEGETSLERGEFVGFYISSPSSLSFFGSQICLQSSR